ncbi:Uncharacterised protein [Legionella wadsworthii]|uniref:Uncharacterized protein n=1 Tax=Legionella wadsworthii TaxID=28088 RepID=A0A378M1G0_9GAMM|nr:hypothetical protein [Legionella wadsworthii]STY30384.1 Uncharacterised protein [Legionella wadsworthii]
MSRSKKGKSALKQRNKKAADKELDKALKDTFPASDSTAKY